MNIFGELKNNVVDIELEKIILLPEKKNDRYNQRLGFSEKQEQSVPDNIIINFLHNDWSFECDNSICNESHFSFYFYGISPQLIALSGSKRNKIYYIKLIGKGFNADTGNKESFVWNIPCSMHIDDLQIDKNGLDKGCVTWINLVGEMW